MIVDVGWYRDEVNTDIPNVDLTNGQQHVVNVRRRNRGRTLILQVRDHIESSIISSDGTNLKVGGTDPKQTAKKMFGWGPPIFWL